ncbi:MAG TPA: hypothetical protein VI248_01765 [Kineosporiaceae bacterium]
MTPATGEVLVALLADHRLGREVFLAQVCRAAGVVERTAAPLMTRLEGAGLVAARMEGEGPWTAGRPWRRYYQLTPAGVEVAVLVVAVDQLPVGSIGRFGASTRHGL